MEPVTTALAGIALVKKSVDFIKENIQTCQDIGQLIGHVENAMVGEQQIIKERDKKGADPFATENVAQEIIDAKIAREHLNELKNLINLRFGPNTWQEILTERKRRIDGHFNLLYDWFRCLFDSWTANLHVCNHFIRFDHFFNLFFLYFTLSSSIF